MIRPGPVVILKHQTRIDRHVYGLFQKTLHHINTYSCTTELMNQLVHILSMGALFHGHVQEMMAKTASLSHLPLRDTLGTFLCCNPTPPRCQYIANF